METRAFDASKCWAWYKRTVVLYRGRADGYLPSAFSGKIDLEFWGARSLSLTLIIFLREWFTAHLWLIEKFLNECLKSISVLINVNQCTAIFVLKKELSTHLREPEHFYYEAMQGGMIFDDLKDSLQRNWSMRIANKQTNKQTNMANDNEVMSIEGKLTIK